MALIRRLLPSDFAAVADLIRPHNTYMGFDKAELHQLWNQAVRLSERSPDFDSFFLTDLKKYYLTPSGHMIQMFGYFENDQLKSAMGIRKFSRFPSWEINRMVAQKGEDLFGSGLAMVYEHCLNYCEGEGLGEYFTCLSEDTYLLHERQWRAHVPSKLRYFSVTEEVVPPRSAPTYEELVRLTRPTPKAMVIRKHILKDEFRTELLENRRRTWQREMQKWENYGQAESAH